MSNDLIKKRDERTKQRKARKKRIDSLIGLAKETDSNEYITLSANVAVISDTNQVARLLDEGYCDNGFILKKGTIEKYLHGENEYVTGWEMVDGAWQRTDVLNLTNDFVGTVNLGHKDFATDPYILGEFTKDDFTLVDLDDDRKALDVNVRLDEESVFVKELRRQPYDIGVSAEFYYHVDWEATNQLEEQYGMWMPVIDEIFIFAYGLVGECGNVNSSGLELKGETMKKEEILNENELLEEETEELGAEELDITANEEETEAETAEEAVEEAETDEPADDEEEAEEEDSEEEAKDEEAEVEEAEDSDEDDGEEVDDESDLSEELSIVESLKEQIKAQSTTIAELTEANAKLKKTNRKLSSKLQKELDKKEQFKANLKDVAVELLPDEEKKSQKEEKIVTNKNYYHGDGIGEI